ncbi:MAG: threonine aldolase family protein [Eubacterium sp.]|jgi:threonine aldolase
MIFFESDYSQGAHPKVMEALERTNLEHADGYALDPHCEHAAQLVRDLIGAPDAAVHMMIGGTNCNVTTIAATLKPYQSVISARSGHIYKHETGSVEATGHRVTTVPGIDGKITPEMIDAAFDEYEDEHTLVPAMVYISEPTESGTLYKKAELEAISAKCRERGLVFYIDGARLGSALTCDECDFTIKDIAPLCDAFYIGGTKNGALMGEALVILNPEINDHFRWYIKQKGGMLAKGRLIGVQFEALLDDGENSLYFKIARETNQKAKRLREGLKALGVSFFGTSCTNQIFPYLPVEAAKKLHEDFMFLDWAPAKDGIIPVRFVCGWGTTDEEVDALLEAVKKALGK